MWKTNRRHRLVVEAQGTHFNTMHLPHIMFGQMGALHANKIGVSDKNRPQYLTTIATCI